MQLTDKTKIESKKLAEKLILKLASDLHKLKTKPKLTRTESKELGRLIGLAEIYKNVIKG